MKTKLAKNSEKYLDEIDRIIGEKMNNGTLKRIPKNKIGVPLVQQKMLKSKYYQPMKEELIKNDFEPEI